LYDTPLASPSKTLYNDINERGCNTPIPCNFPCDDFPGGHLLFAPPEDVILGVCVLGDVRIAAARSRPILRDRLSSRGIGFSQAKQAEAQIEALSNHPKIDIKRITL